MFLQAASLLRAPMIEILHGDEHPTGKYPQVYWDMITFYGCTQPFVDEVVGESEQLSTAR